MEAQTFCRVLGESLKNLRKLCVSTKFSHIKNLIEITVFYAVVMTSHYFIGCSFQISFKYEMLCAIWYHLYKLKTVKSTHGEVLLLVKLQAQACFTLKHCLNFLSPISKESTGSCSVVVIWKESAARVEGVIVYVIDGFQLIVNDIIWWNKIMLMVINKQVEVSSK